MKRGRLSEKDRKYIVENVDKGVKKLAKKLERSEVLVSKVLESLKTVVKETESPTENVTVANPVTIPQRDEAAIRQKYGVTIATPMDSAKVDEAKDKVKSVFATRQDCVQKCKP